MHKKKRVIRVKEDGTQSAGGDGRAGETGTEEQGRRESTPEGEDGNGRKGGGAIPRRGWVPTCAGISFMDWELYKLFRLKYFQASTQTPSTMCRFITKYRQGTIKNAFNLFTTILQTAPS